MSLTLDEIEKRLQVLIEGHLIQFIPDQKLYDNLSRQLALAIKSNISTNRFNKDAPDVFTFIVHPNVSDEWQDNDTVIEKLGEIIQKIASETGLKFEEKPTITISPDKLLGTDEVRVLASQRINSNKVAQTQSIEEDEESSQSSEPDVPANAFLIISGVKVFSLNQTVINIGRRMDNHLVLDDPRISRYHAQIRALNGRFVLFDLNSTGGTYVNGQRITQTVLYAGDVISLAGLPVVFGQDNPPTHPGSRETRPSSTASSERPTAILRDPDEDD